MKSSLPLALWMLSCAALLAAAHAGRSSRRDRRRETPSPEAPTTAWSLHLESDAPLEIAHVKKPASVDQPMIVWLS